MIHFVTGKPGGGKTLTAVRILSDELRHTKRGIVTNLPLKMGELNAYMQAKYPDQDVRLLQRIRLLSDDEVKRFYLYRINTEDGSKIDLPPEDDRGRIDFRTAGPSVLYILDELHLFFNAREWASTGKGALFYNSQHRKLGDDVVGITQFLGNVDKQFRVLAQDFTTIRNYSNEKVGWFRLPAVFERRVYQENPGPNTPCSERGTFTLDVSGIAQVYDTGAGVGIMGRADMGNKKRGLNWKWVIPIGLAAIIVLAMIPTWAGGYVMRLFLGPVQAVQKVQAQGSGTNTVSGPGNAIQGMLPIRPINPEPKKQDAVEQTRSGAEEVKQEVFVTGHVMLGKGKAGEKFYLNNGEIIGGWQVVCEQAGWVYLQDGRRYRWIPGEVAARRAAEQSKLVASMGQPPGHSVGVFNP